MKTRTDTERRHFLTVFAGTAAGITMGGASGSAREKLREFNYSDVVLTGGPLKNHFDRVHAQFLTLDTTAS